MNINEDTSATSQPIAAELAALVYSWDWKSRAIVAGADELESLPDAERERALTALGQRVRAITGALDDGQLLMTAFCMVEDLYRSCFNEFRWSSGVYDYIAATAAVLMQGLERRGFVLHYVIDNTKSDTNLDEIVVALSWVFKAAGLFVAGPQLMALDVMEHVEKRAPDVTAMRRYRGDGYIIANELIERCHRERRPSVYLNLDINDDTPALPLDVALSQTNTAGTLVVFRDQSPTPGSIAHINAPPGVTLPVPR